MRTLRHSVVAILLAVMTIGLTAQGTPAPASDIPIAGLAGITFRVSDLDKARRYYNGVLGFAEAFTLKDAQGRVSSVFFKVNDDQFVEVVPGLQPGGMNRQVRVVFQSTDLKKLRDTYSTRGLNPTPITRGPDGNPVFRVMGPDAATLDFIEYAADSPMMKTRGKLLDPRRLSTHLWHVGIYTKDRES